ncbi:MAG: PAS domain S-box protein [Bacteroidota bacterium]|nr:PAS domain S-box protein [Bacteroidota bacterium]
MKRMNFLFLAIKTKKIDSVIEYLVSKDLNFDYKLVDRKIRFRKALNEKNWDIVFLDDSIVSISIIEALGIVSDERPALPRIVLFEKIDEDELVSVMKHGAYDVVIKNKLSRLIPAIQNCLSSKELRIPSVEAESMLGKYDFIMNTSSSLLTLIDRKYRYKAVNNSFRSAHNLTKTDILGKDLSEIWGWKKFKEVIKPSLDECFSNKEVQYKAWFETPTLGMRYFKVTYFPFSNKESEVSHAIVETVDITKEKEMEDQIAKGDSEMSSIIENTRDYFWSMDKEFNLIFANQPYRKFINRNYSISIKAGNNMLDFLPVHERKVWKQRYLDCIAGKHLSFEQSYLSDKGLNIYEVSLNPVFTENDEIIGMSCLSREITERRNNEEKIRNQAEDLALINKLNNALNSGYSEQRIMGILARETQQMFHGFGAVIYLLSEDGRNLLPVNTRQTKQIQENLLKILGGKPSRLKIPLQNGDHYSTVLTAGKPALSDTPELIKKIFENYSSSKIQSKIIQKAMRFVGLKSVFTIPLISGDETFGIFDIGKKTYFTETELRRIMALADQVTSILKKKIDEEKIHQSEKKFRNIFEAANDSIFILENNIFIDCNNKTLEIFRCTKEEIIGKTPLDYSPEFQPDGRASDGKAMEMIKRAFKGDEVRFEWVHKKKDGVNFFTEVSLTPMEYDEGSYLQAIVRDITIRKESENLLLESEERFRAVFEDAADALFLIDPESGMVIDVNNYATSLLNKPKDEILGIHITQNHPENQKERLINFFFGKGEDKSSSISDVIYMLRGNLEKVPVEVQAKSIQIGGKEVIQASFRDISEKFKSQLELIRNEELLTETQEIAQLGSWEMDIESRKFSWSKETYKIIGFKVHSIEPSYTEFKSKIHLDDKRMFEEKLELAINEKKNFESEFRILKHDGESRNVIARAKIKKDNRSGQTKLIGSIHDVTELKKVENALRESEVKFRTLFMQGHFGMLLEDVDGNIIQANKAFENMFGYKKSELTKELVRKLTHPEDVERSQQFIQKIMNREVDSFDIEKRYIVKDGSVLWGHTGCAAIKDSNAKITHIIIMIVDISHEKNIEKQNFERTKDLSLINNLNLHVNSDYGLESILDLFSDQIWKQFQECSFRLMLWDNQKQEFNFRYLHVPDNATSELKEFLLEVKDDKPFKLKLNSKFHTAFSKRMPWVVNSEDGILDMIGEVLSIEGAKLDTKKVYSIINARSMINFPLHIGDDVLGHAICVCPNIISDSEVQRLSNIIEHFAVILKRKLVEEEEARLFTAMEQLNETVVITNIQGEIEYANQAFEKSSGYLRKDAVGKNPSILKSGKQSNEFYKVLWKTIMSGKTWSGKIINKNKNGNLYEERVNITPVKDEHGKITNFVAVKRDITRENILEAQLRQSQKLETVGTLAGGIAHDFNNIIGTLLGYNEMITEDIPEDSKAKEYLNHMTNTMNRAKELINKILTFSKNMEPEAEMVDLSQLLESSLALFRPSIPSNIKITKVVCGECRPISLDPSQMQQVFTNLLNNSAQALSEKGGEIKILLQLLSDPEKLWQNYPGIPKTDYVELLIEDNGPGMEQRIKDRIFEPFFTTRPVGEGTGLGLAVVHGIITGHNGIIKVNTAPGQGTTFKIYLPIY